jgi:hypothetical protein
MENRKITNVDRFVRNEETWWRVTFDVVGAPPGTPAVHYYEFPDSTFEWRIAEYGFDPTDVDSIMDVILSEPFLGNVQSVHLTETPAEARRIHLARCAEAKLLVKMSSRGIENPVEMIRTAFRGRPGKGQQNSSLKEKKSIVEAARRHHQEMNRG